MGKENFLTNEKIRKQLSIIYAFSSNMAPGILTRWHMTDIFLMYEGSFSTPQVHLFDAFKTKQSALPPTHPPRYNNP